MSKILSNQKVPSLILFRDNMRIFVFHDPDGVHQITEEEIKELYYPYWKTAMNKVKKEGTFEDCIEDFIIVHWAYEVKKNDSGRT